jgi:hypothetical protein
VTGATAKRSDLWQRPPASVKNPRPEGLGVNDPAVAIGIKEKKTFS